MKTISHISHGLGDHVTGHCKPNVSQNGAPKHVTAVEYHSGMTRQQTVAAKIGGMGHATATIDGGQTIASSAAAAPMQHAYGGKLDFKTGKAVNIHPSHARGVDKDELRQLGDAILQEATRN